MSNRNQYVFINRYESGLAALNCGVHQVVASVLGPLLFLLYIKYLNQVIKFCKVHRFADDINILYLCHSIKKTKQTSQCSLKASCKLVKCKKNFTQCKKTEMIIFKFKQKKFEGDLKVRLCGKRLYSTESVKYLGVKIDTNLSWQYHVNDLSIKLNRANALLFK